MSGDNVQEPPFETVHQQPRAQRIELSLSHQVDTEFLSDKKAIRIAGSIIGRISCTTEVSDGAGAFIEQSCADLTHEHSSGNHARNLAHRKTGHFKKVVLYRGSWLTHPYTAGVLLPDQRERWSWIAAPLE
jgi:hypothetical protein